MRIAEIYKSIQGEGLLTGRESIFVRASGCNLRCWFCDTKYASWNPVGSDFSVDSIVKQILIHDCKNVVITGGEPMLFSELVPICDQLSANNVHITIETAGTLYLDVKCNLMSISPKLGNSAPPLDQNHKWHARHEKTRHQPDVVMKLIKNYSYQFKFVIDAPSDVAEVEQYLSEFPAIDKERVLLMPQATSAKEMDESEIWMKSICDEKGFMYCPRMQISWFGLKQGT